MDIISECYQNKWAKTSCLMILIQGVISLQDMTSYYKTKHIAPHQWIRELIHTGYAAIKNINTIDEPR